MLFYDKTQQRHHYTSICSQVDIPMSLLNIGSLGLFYVLSINNQKEIFIPPDYNIHTILQSLIMGPPITHLSEAMQLSILLYRIMLYPTSNSYHGTTLSYGPASLKNAPEPSRRTVIIYPPAIQTNTQAAITSPFSSLATAFPNISYKNTLLSSLPATLFRRLLRKRSTMRLLPITCPSNPATLLPTTAPSSPPSPSTLAGA